MASTPRKVTLEGTAGNAKAGAVVMVDRVPHYIAGLDAWPADVDGATVRVEGTLHDEKHIPDPVGPQGELRQGAEGTQRVLRDATWTVVRRRAGFAP